MAVSISIGITQNNRIIENNKSNVTVTVTATWTGGSHNAVISSDGKAQARGWVKIDGTKYNFYSTFNENETNSGSKIICEKIVDVSHKDDGSKTLSCSASYTTGVSSGTVTASASKTLTAIPRKSTLSAENGELGETQTLTVSRQSASFTHTITYKCGTASGTVVTESSSTSISFTPPVSLASQSKDGLYVSVVFTITTYNGDDPLGSTTKTITCYIPDSSDTNPTVSLSVSDAMGYAGTYGGYVQNKSKLKITVTASGKEGADIKSRTTTISKVVNDVKTTLKTYTDSSFTTDVLSTSGALVIDTTVIDSRGRKATDTEEITVFEYSPPRITDLSTYRSNVSGTLDEAGNYITIKFSAEVSTLNSENTATYKYAYRKVGSTGDFTPVPVNALSNIFNPTNHKLTFTADKGSSFDISLSVTDKFETVEKSSTGQTATKTFSIFSKGLGWAFGKVAEVRNALDVAWNIIARKDIYMGYYHDTEKNIFFKNNAEHTGKTYSSNSVYPHNCRLYGGSSSSPIGIGLYDTKKKRRIFAYNDHENYVETQVNIRQHVFQAYPGTAVSISSLNSWVKISLTASSLDGGLNPSLDNGTSSLFKFFELTTDGGIECNRSGYVMISGQLYLDGLTAADSNTVGACISVKTLKDDGTYSSDEYLTWNYVKHAAASAYIPIVPLVVPVTANSRFYLLGRNASAQAGRSSNTYKTTHLTIQYVG